MRAKAAAAVLAMALRLMLAIACLLAASASLSAWAQDVLPVPALTGRVLDQTATLTPPQVAELSAKLAHIEDTLGSQVVVLLVPTTQPEDNAAYAQRVADTWKLGRRDVGDGLLIVVATQDRKVRIEVAKTLEGAIPDLMAKRIISEQITPAFKAGDYAGGLNAAADAIAARIRGEGLPQPQHTPTHDAFELDLEGWLAFLFIGVPLAGTVLTSVLGRKLGAVATGAGFGTLGWWATASLWMGGLIGVGALVMVGLLGNSAARRTLGRSSGRRSGGPAIWTGGGGSGGWGGGGGFGSGGGGDFGGGGASGDW